MLELPWFQMLPDKDITNQIRPRGIPVHEYSQQMSGKDFIKLQDRVGLYERKPGLEICDFLFEPTFMIGKNMISLFRSLAPDVETKTLALFSTNNKGQGINYWIPYLPPVDCLKKDRDRCYVRPSSLSGRNIAKYEGKREVRWLFSLTAAEQILSRGPIGSHFVKLPMISEVDSIENNA